MRTHRTSAKPAGRRFISIRFRGARTSTKTSHSVRTWVEFEHFVQTHTAWITHEGSCPCKGKCRLGALILQLRFSTRCESTKGVNLLTPYDSPTTEPYLRSGFHCTPDYASCNLNIKSYVEQPPYQRWGRIAVLRG